MKKPIITLILGIAIGFAAMFIINKFQSSDTGSASSGSTSDAPKEKKPLYWVAPMDPNYKRDKPGKSPMGMDLIAFYADEGGGVDEGPGTIRVSPDVINNLGVITAKVKMKTMHTQINTVGYVQYDEDEMVKIYPRVDGWIEKLYVKAAGDPVKNGQVLYEIYSPALVNAQEELILALSRKNKRLISAAKDRLKSLQIPDQAIRKLISTKKVQQNIAFYAPQDGYVEDLNIRQGNFVKPGTNIMSIAKLDKVWVEAEVFERQAGLVSVGTAVSMTLDFLPGRTWRGNVDYIYPKLDAKTRTLRVRLRFDNSDLKLKPNMFAQVSIHIQDIEPTLLVSKQAVIRTGQSNRVVLALGEGKFKSIEVRVGRIDNDHIEILSGINEGERVVTSAQFLLDSESSKTSDFKRMNHEAAAQEEDKPASATTTGTINSIMLGHRMLNISREAIEEWGRPAATLDFMVDENIDIESLQNNNKIYFTFMMKDGQFVITNIQALASLDE